MGDFCQPWWAGVRSKIFLSKLPLWGWLFGFLFPSPRCGELNWLWNYFLSSSGCATASPGVGWQALTQGPVTSTGSGSWCLTLSPWQRMEQVLGEGDSIDSFPMRAASFHALLLEKQGEKKAKNKPLQETLWVPPCHWLISWSDPKFLWVQHHFGKVTSDRCSQGKHPFEDKPPTHGNSCPDLGPWLICLCFTMAPQGAGGIIITSW